jgi:hypothetical protein
MLYAQRQEREIETAPAQTNGFTERLIAEWHDPGQRIDLLMGACALLLGLFSVSSMIAAAALSYTRLPMFDEWGVWHLQISKTDWWSFILAPHNEHRIPVPRLLYLLIEK